MGRRKTLADRIANSTCRRCGKPGHWKRERPLGASSSSTGDIKKIADGEAFTGIMTDEYLAVDSDKKAIQDEGNEVISQLPANAQCYHHGTLEVGKVSKIQGSCGDGPIQSNPKVSHNPGMNHGGECDNPECVFLGIGERGSRSLQQTLVHHLRKCCRNTDSKTAVATHTHEPVRSDATFLQSQEPSAGGHEIFNAEVAADEAIIDTGARRAVIGSDRLEMLVRSFPPRLEEGSWGFPLMALLSSLEMLADCQVTMQSYFLELQMTGYALKLCRARHLFLSQMQCWGSYGELLMLRVDSLVSRVVMFGYHCSG